MRRLGIFLSVCVVTLLGIGFATGQAPFGGFGGFGGQLQLDGVALLRNAQVKKELELTDEQLEKLPAAVNKAIKEVLDEKQFKRFQQIELQLKGTRAYGDPAVQTQLGLTAEQKENINTILEDMRKQIDEIRKESKGFGGGEKTRAVTKEAEEKLQTVLTADQKKTWRRMTGEEFKLEFKGFGGGNFGKKKNQKDIQE